MVNHNRGVFSHMCNWRCVVSKMGDWVLELEHDKVDLTREQFAGKHGHMFAYIYDEQLGIIPEVHSTRTRSCDENTRTSKDNRQIPV